MSNPITGNWLSHYEYGRGSNDEPQISEHTIAFVQDGDFWIGTSQPNEENSVLTITLSQNDNEFRGEWRERTAPNGPYKGREFSGVILLLQTNDDTLEGMWLGASSSTDRVKSGAWTLNRESDR